MQSMGICQFRIKFSEIILLHEKIHGKKTLDWSNHKPLLKNIIKLQVQSYFCADNWMQIGCKLLKKIILNVLFPFTKEFCFSSINLYVNSREMLRNGLASNAKKYTFVFNADFLHSFLQCHLRLSKVYAFVEKLA